MGQPKDRVRPHERGLGKVDQPLRPPPRDEQDEEQGDGQERADPGIGGPHRHGTRYGGNGDQARGEQRPDEPDALQAA